MVGGFLETLLDLDDADPAVMQPLHAVDAGPDRPDETAGGRSADLSRLESNVQVASDDPVNMPQLLQTLLAGSARAQSAAPSD